MESPSHRWGSREAAPSRWWGQAKATPDGHNLPSYLRLLLRIRKNCSWLSDLELFLKNDNVLQDLPTSRRLCQTAVRWEATAFNASLAQIQLAQVQPKGASRNPLLKLPFALLHVLHHDQAAVARQKTKHLHFLSSKKQRGKTFRSFHECLTSVPEKPGLQLVSITKQSCCSTVVNLTHHL